MAARRWELIHYGRPISLNDYRKRHWKDRSDGEWKDAYAVLAKLEKVPRLARARFEAQGFGPGNEQDPGNCYPSVKAAIDGVVLAGVLPDDRGVHVRGITLLPWRKASRPGLRLVIEEVE